MRLWGSTQGKPNWSNIQRTDRWCWKKWEGKWKLQQDQCRNNQRMPNMKNELRKKKLFFLWFMTFSKVTTDKEGLGECVWWGKETEILAGRVESMGLVAEVVVARMKISWILSKGGRQMIYLSFHFQYCLSPSSGFQAKLGEMGSGIMPSWGNHLANASHALALRFILMETICH